MRNKAKIIPHLIFGFVLLLATVCVAADITTLPMAQFEKLKKQKCVFIHAWAGWCDTCVDEMPKVVQFLAKQKKITPVVFDLSEKSLQASFSIGFMKKINPPFKTYLKPQAKEEALLTAIDPQWSGALPYSIIYSKGKKKIAWLGSLDTTQAQRGIDQYCR